MQTAWTRRAAGTTTAAAVLAALAGCQAPSGSPGTSARPEATPACDDTTTTAGRPPTDDERRLVREYPDLPDEITAASTERYATSFEEAYQLNRLAERSSTSAYEVKEVFNLRSDDVESGFVVSFEIDLAWKKESGDMTVSADETVPVTYFVSPRRVIRYEGSTEANPREDGVGEVVVCRES